MVAPFHSVSNPRVVTLHQCTFNAEYCGVNTSRDLGKWEAIAAARVLETGCWQRPQRNETCCSLHELVSHQICCGRYLKAPLPLE